MSLAAEARAAVRERPFLLAALRAGVVNHTAAARYLAVDGDEEAVATALRRFAADLEPIVHEGRDARVTMESGLGPVDDAAAEEPLFSVAGTALASGGGELTGVLATGEVDAAALSAVLARLGAAAVDVEAAGVAGAALLVVVERRDGPDALRAVEDALAAVPESASRTAVEE